MLHGPLTPVQKKNFRVNIAEGSLFVAGATFISAQIVLPALVAGLGGGNVAVGSVGVIMWVGLFLPQIFAARVVETLPWKKPWAIRFGALQRVMLLLMGVVVMVFGPDRPMLALAGLLTFFALNQAMLGITTPGWFDLFAKVTPPGRRGRLVGLRNSIGGVAAFLCGLVLTWILATLAFPMNFGIAIMCAFILQSGSIVVQLKMVEEEPSVVREQTPVFRFLRELPLIVRGNREFGRFLIASGFLIVATMPIGFFTVYGLRAFNADESAVGTFTLVMVAIQVVSAVVTGHIADRYGHKVALVCTTVSLLCASLWALVAPSLAWFTLVYMFLGINLGSEVMIRYNMSIEYGPVAQRATYVGLMNTILAPLYLSGLAGGWISNLFGYKTVFAVGAVSSLIGAGYLILRVKDPQRSIPAVSAPGPQLSMVE
jgi:MFS family permease